MPYLAAGKIYLLVLGAFVGGVAVSAGGVLDGLQAVTNPRAKHNNSARVDILFICGLTLTQLFESASISLDLDPCPRC